MKIPGGFQALRACLQIRDFRYYVAGNVTHGLGIWLLRMSIGWLAWKLEESTAWLGAVAMAETAPSLILSLFAGTVVDRFNFVRLMQVTQSLSAALAACLAVLTLTGTITIWMLFFLTVFRGCLMAFNRPSRTVLVHHLVGRDLLAPALALGSIIHNGTRFIGPAIGGVIIAGAGVGWGFVAASVLIGFYSAVLVFLAIEIEPRRRKPRSMLHDTLEGIKYIAGHDGIRTQLVLLVAMGLLVRPVVDLLPGYAGQVFATGPGGLAMLLAAHGIGATLAGVWIASRASGLVGMTRLNLLSVLFVSAMLAVFAATTFFWLAVAASVLFGFGLLVLTVTSQTMIQSAVAPDFRGRVVSVHGLVMIGIPSLGAMALGGVAEYLGLRLPVLVGAAAFALAWAWAWHRRHALAEVLEAAPQPAAETT